MFLGLATSQNHRHPDSFLARPLRLRPPKKPAKNERAPRTCCSRSSQAMIWVGRLFFLWCPLASLRVEADAHRLKRFEPLFGLRSIRAVRIEFYSFLIRFHGS